jgi:hypothetical protein
MVAKQRVEHLLAIRAVLQFLQVYLYASPTSIADCIAPKRSAFGTS